MLKKINNIIYFLYYSLFFVTPLLMYHQTSELFEFNKMIFIYLASTLIIFAAILKKILFKQEFFVKNFLSRPILLFLAALILSTVFSIDTQTSLFGYYGRFNGGLFSILAYIGLFFVFISVANKAFIEKLLKVSLLSSFLVMLWGLTGKMGYDLSCLVFIGKIGNTCWSDQFRPAERMFSTLGQPNWLGAYLAINFFIGLYFYLKHSYQKPAVRSKHLAGPIPWLFLGYLALNFICILFTRSRSAIIALGVGFLIFTVIIIKFLLKKDNKLLKTVKNKLSFVAVLMIFSILIFKTGIEKVDKLIALNSKQPQNAKSQAQKQPQLSSEVTESLDIRKIVWKGAVQLGLKYPLFGTGNETFAYSYYFTRPKEHNLTSEWDFLYNKAHNEYLNYFATTGFVGLISYLVMIGSAVYLFFERAKRVEKFSTSSNDNLLILSLLCAYITILITNFFGFSTTTINLFFYLIPAIGVAYIYGFSKNNDQQELSRLNLKSYLKIFVVTVGACYVLLFLFNYIRADIIYAQADNYSKVEEYTKAVPLLHRTLEIHSEHVYEDKLSTALANLALISSFQKDDKLTQDLIKASTLYNLKSIRSSQKNVLYWKTKAKNDYIFYQIEDNEKYLDDAIESLKTAKMLAPTDPRISYTLAVLYDSKADLSTDTEQSKGYRKQALSEVDESINIKEDYVDTQLLKKNLLMKSKQ